MKKIIQAFFGIFGVRLIRKTPNVNLNSTGFTRRVNENSMEEAMKRGKEIWNVNPGTVIDLGAAAGTWTEKSMREWPNCDYLLFEPLIERKNELETLATKFSNVRPVLAAAGRKKGTISFTVSDDLDGSGVYDSQKTGGNREVQIVRIDDVTKEFKSKGPFVLKFDTHGFEVPILEGAVETLKETSLVIMECYGFKLSADCLTFPEMCEKMKIYGFRLADVVEIMRRPGDKAFWQCDALFLKETHSVFEMNGYK